MTTESPVWNISGRIAATLAFLMFVYVGSFGVILVDEQFGPKLIYQGIKAALPESHDRVFQAMRTFYRPLLTVLGY